MCLLFRPTIFGFGVRLAIAKLILKFALDYVTIDHMNCK